MLEVLFRSRVTAKLLAYFMKNFNREAYLREISREVDEPASAVQRELVRLEEFGLLKSRKHGNHKYFIVRKDFPILPELIGLYRKTDGVVDYLKGSLEQLGDVRLAFIYGPFAATPGVDMRKIDIAIIGTSRQEELARLIEILQADLGRAISYKHYEPDEFRYLLEIKDTALQQILNGEKIILVANISEKVSR